VSLCLLQQLEHIVGCVRLTEPRENLLDTMTVRFGVSVRHCIHNNDDVVALRLTCKFKCLYLLTPYSLRDQ
jgi:hypothetical protein